MRICSIEGCDKKYYGLNWCHMHYERMRVYGSLEKQIRTRYKSILEAWESNLIKNPDNECWGWLGVVSNYGYAKISFGRPQPLGHRFSFELHNGPIPDDMCICHHCDNRLCTNPSHLFLGTVNDNIQDMVQKGRHYGCHKLTENEVLKIKKMIAEGINNRVIAKEFNVIHQTISAIKTGQTWRHIE